MIYKKIFRQFDKNKIFENGIDKYYSANAENVEKILENMNADYIILESDISDEDSVKKNLF